MRSGKFNSDSGKIFTDLDIFESHFPHPYRASLVAQLVKKPPALREVWVRSLGWEDPLEEGKVTHSSILAWRILWIVQFMGSQSVRQNSNFHFHFIIYIIRDYY